MTDSTPERETVPATPTPASSPPSGSAPDSAKATTGSPMPDPAPSAARHRVRPATAVTARLATRVKTPYARLAFGGFLMLALVAGTVVFGALIVPRSATPRSVAATSVTPPATSPSMAGPTVSATAGSPSPSVTSAPAPNAGLTEWAERLAPRVEIPPVALRAYGYAEWVLAQRNPTCRLSWTTLAAIGKVESNHGRSGASTLGADGRALPPIIGPALDGKDGRRKITDTDAGALDSDRAYDHAVGPMQFIPSTWRRYAYDGDSDGIADPSDIDDAALAAGFQLCAPGKDLTVAANWQAAILSYNNVATYVQAVFIAANNYGSKSRS